MAGVVVIRSRGGYISDFTERSASSRRASLLGEGDGFRSESVIAASLRCSSDGEVDSLAGGIWRGEWSNGG